jgi:Outer membrane protein beta-barrel domain
MTRTLNNALLTILLVTGSAAAFAQGDTDCLTTLSHAENEFAAGRFVGIPDMLKDCLDRNRFSNEEKVRVYMLLSQVYLLTDNPGAADESYLKLLGANPEYVPSDLDPIDIVYLSKKFTSTPIFTPHVKVGGNLSTQSVIYNQNTSSTPDSTVINHVPLAGWTAGAGVEWNITDNVGLGGEVLVSQKLFRRNIEGIFRHDSQSYTERQLWLDIPVYLRYGMNATGRFRPYVYAGGAVNLLLVARAEEVLNDRTIGVGTEADAVTTTAAPARNIMYKRNFFNRSLVFGVGTKIKFNKDFITIDLRYMPGLSSVVNLKTNNYGSRERDMWDESATQYASVSDIFRVNNYSISIGYVRPIYNPRKANRVKTKSVSKRLGRDDK